MRKARHRNNVQLHRTTGRTTGRKRTEENSDIYTQEDRYKQKRTVNNRRGPGEADKDRGNQKRTEKIKRGQTNSRGQRKPEEDRDTQKSTKINKRGQGQT